MTTSKETAFEKLAEAMNVDASNWDDVTLMLNASVRIERLEAERSQALEFHPRAMGLIKKNKNFIVIAEDEPYYMRAYEMIRAHEKRTGRWTEEDEKQFLKGYLIDTRELTPEEIEYGKNLYKKYFGDSEPE